MQQSIILVFKLILFGIELYSIEGSKMGMTAIRPMLKLILLHLRWILFGYQGFQVLPVTLKLKMYTTSVKHFTISTSIK